MVNATVEHAVLFMAGQYLWGAPEAKHCMRMFIMIMVPLHHACILDHDHMCVQGVTISIKACVRKEKALHAASQKTVILQLFANADSVTKTECKGQGAPRGPDVAL